MFGRRKRSVSQHRHVQPLSTPASQSAQSAASHAFLRSQPSTTSLSSAAAATALRNRTPTPTNVENVQTKRMVQRAASSHSPTNPLPTRRSASVSGPLRRTNSSSSMTARTFREPSPHRPSTSSGPVNVHQQQPVSVPPLPSFPAQYAGRQEPTRRATSLQPTVRSPPASPRSARGSDRGGSTSPLHNRISSLTTVPEFDRPSSRGSVNFSYPRGLRPNSPPSPAILEDQPITLGAVTEQPGPQQTISEKPIITRPTIQTAGITDGSHATKPAASVTGTAATAAQAVIGAPKKNARADPHARVERIEHEPTSAPQDNEPPATHPSSRTAPEHWPATTTEKSKPRDPTHVDTSLAQRSDTRQTAGSPTPDVIDTVVTPQPSPSASTRESKQQHEINVNQSSSPGRSARFSKWLSVSSPGSQVHQPPARSVSPVKSALKNSPRGSSLSPDRKVSVSGIVFQPPSEISDGTSVASDEGSRLNVKKRAPKVSFDDEAEIVGVAASPPTSPEDYTPGSPPPKVKSRMSWLGVGKKKQPTSDLGAGDDGFDEVLKPRAALPSFGSVRGTRDGGPQEPVIPEYSDNESSDSSDDEVATTKPSFSNDHAIGGILHKVPEVEQTHNVKAVEQSSVTGQSSPAQQQAAPRPKIDGVALGGITEQTPFTNADSHIAPPSIAVEPATPPIDSDRPSRELQRMSRSSLEQYQIPGGFPPSASDRSLKSAADSTQSQPQPMASAIPSHVDDVDTEGESGDSVYSDAAEDFDGDGFGSINAIVDSRSIPRSSAPLDTVDESRDTTPRPVRRSPTFEDEPDYATMQATDKARAATPTQDYVIRQQEDIAVAVPVQPEVVTSSPPLPAKSKARTLSNDSAQIDSSEQRRPVSMSFQGTSSSQQGPRKFNTVSSPGKDKPRPKSLGPAFQGTRGAGTAGFPNSLRRTTSNGSDSSSSFKRASSSVRGDGHIMRRTMRAGGGNFQGPPSDRTDSPTDRRPMSSGSGQGTGTLRKTLRGLPGGAGGGGGGGGGGNERYSFFSTNKRAAPSPRGRSARQPSRSTQGTPFRDSDEEREDDQPQAFRSRFIDSSDEEEQGSTSMRPVRGIPRRKGAHDGDSTDLDDSSEEERRQQSRYVPAVAVAPRVDPTPPASRDQNAPPNMSGMAAVARQRGMSQRELEEFIMQPPKGRKSGLFSRLGLTKSKTVDNRIRKADVESPSRRDTPLERSRLEREQLRVEHHPYGTPPPAPGIVTTVTATQPEQPASPQKLLKKNSKRYTTGGTPWPLRPTAARINSAEPPLRQLSTSIPEQSASVPNSPLRSRMPPLESTGRNGSVTINGGGGPETSAIKAPESPQIPRAGPDLNDDAASDITRSTEDNGPVARDVVIAGSGRKKRFPMLRKAFGLRA
ncbi:hypothetical protein N7478_011080 [Penicillium angulare]|uniref:uncharacterized protein n=1 Tax=Penicillium angulare TaxID=116970 RepID=UPI002540482C|nr:uncharacterized protein N7478_011080 [Penicillium angulare]KAJ5263475.1 hypothetical protein N7478_011080 [Penicillium angulare]